MNRYDKIKTLCDERGISIKKLETECGLSNGYIGKLRKSKPNADYLMKIANYLQVPFEVLDNDDYIYSHSTSTISREEIDRNLKSLYQVAAGNGTFNPQFALDTIEDNEDGFEFAKVVGDSMLPELRNGDIIKVQLQTETTPHDYTLVKIDGEYATVKFLEITENGIWLRALNKEVFEDKFYSIQEVMTLPITVIGKVVEVRRSL